MKYIEKQKVVDAILFTGDNYDEVGSFIHDDGVVYCDGFIVLQTDQGVQKVDKGDWIVNDPVSGVSAVYSKRFEQVFDEYVGEKCCGNCKHHRVTPYNEYCRKGVMLRGGELDIHAEFGCRYWEGEE